MSQAQGTAVTQCACVGGTGKGAAPKSLEKTAGRYYGGICASEQVHGGEDLGQCFKDFPMNILHANLFS